MAAHIGTSGWAYIEWKPSFYPTELPQRRFLEHYGSVFNACEVNATFYRLQTQSTVERWAAETPADFRFAAKLHRRLTHSREPAADDDWFDFMEDFLESVAPLGTRLGILLMQFPASRRRDDGALARILDALPPDVPSALEFRHESWGDNSIADRAAEKNATVCLTDTTGDVPDRLPGGPAAYVRLRADRYTEAQRDGWLRLLEREGAERPVFAFAKHKDIPAGDEFRGVGLAEWLQGGLS